MKTLLFFFLFFVGTAEAQNPFSSLLQKRCERDPTKVWNPTTQACDLREPLPTEPPPVESTAITFQLTATSDLTKTTVINEAFKDGRLRSIVPTLKFDPPLELISSLYAVVAVDSDWYVAQRDHVGDVAFIRYFPGRGPLPSYGVDITINRSLREFTVFKTLVGLSLQGISLVTKRIPDKILFYCGLAPGGPYHDFGEFKGIVFEVKGN